MTIMLFQLPEELQRLQSDLREFLDREIRPIADVRDAQGPLSRAELKDLFLKLTPITQMQLEAATKRRMLSWMIFSEEMARVWTSLAVTVTTSLGTIFYLASRAPEHMRARLIKGGLEGDIIGCDMMSEPEAGSDTGNLKTTARLEGDYYVVNGQKMWPTNGPWADVGILSAVADPEAYAKNRREGVIHLIVEKAVSPWQVRDLPFIGLRAGTTGHFIFENCRVPKENLIADSSKGYSQNLAGRGGARIGVAAYGLGIMQAALEDSIDWCKKRIAFGRPIGGFQLVQEMIADMATDLECSRLLVYRAAELMDAGARCDLEQNMAKAFVTEVAKRVTDKAIQIHGARGLTTHEGFRTERYYRDAVTGQIGEGTIQIVKLVIARRTLGISAIA